MQLKVLQEGDLPKQIIFFRQDNTIATNIIAEGFVSENGEVQFYEILGQSEIEGIPTVYVNGKKKYRRLMIQRVYPTIEAEDVPEFEKTIPQLTINN